jgi:hypothetical protein
MTWNGCPSYCPHGSICTVPEGHQSLHGNEACCRWASRDAVSRRVADALMWAYPEAACLLAEGQLAEFLERLGEGK